MQAAKKYKPSNTSSLKSLITLSEIRIQESFKDPIKSLCSWLTLFVYLQCLKYPIDMYMDYWLEDPTPYIFSYIDLGHHLRNVTSIFGSAVGIVIVASWVAGVLGVLKIKNNFYYGILKTLHICFGSFLFMWIIGSCFKTIYFYFYNSDNNESELTVALAFVCLITFTVVIAIQTFLRFDFLEVVPSSGVVKKSNWSGLSCLSYIFINEITSRFTSHQNNDVHLILMAISLVVCIFVFFLKNEHEEVNHLRIELSGILANFVAIGLLIAMRVTDFHTNISFFVILSIILIIGIMQIEFFSIKFELENVNKWSSSQIMISYAAKLRKILLKYYDYHYETLFLGYFEIHQQKCDIETCPMKILPSDDQKKQDRFEELIRKIYNEGCKMTPVNPELLLEYAIFHYESGSKERSLKTLLDINEDELAWDKYYKYCRLKNLIHRELSELQHQDFLDLLSEIKIKDLEEKILKEFESVAFINLEFWSVLNEDHPDFKKLLSVGKSRVLSTNKIHKLYAEISEIAHSEKVTNLYVHYLKQIENDTKSALELQEEETHSKIVIEDWANSSNPVLVVSKEEDNAGNIVDLNLTASTILGYQKYDLHNRNIEVLFKGVLSSQAEEFVTPTRLSEQEFFLTHGNGYTINCLRKYQPFSSMQTGLSCILTLSQNYNPCACFIVLDCHEKIVSYSASCIKLLDFEELSSSNQEKHYSNVFVFPLSKLSAEKISVKKKELFVHCSENQIRQVYSVSKLVYQNFSVIKFVQLKNNLGFDANYSVNESKFENEEKESQEFRFEIGHYKDNFVFRGVQGKGYDTKLKRNSLLIGEIQNEDSVERIDYGLGIKTLRLHENYIKVIEDDIEDNDEENQSQMSTGTELMQIAKISKRDEEMIFEDRKSYALFIDEYEKKLFIKPVIVFSFLCTVGLYILLYFLLQSYYKEIFAKLDALALESEIIGEMASAQNLVLQSENRILYKNTEIDVFLLAEYDERILHFQQLNEKRRDAYMINVQGEYYRSDEFTLAFISMLSSVRAILTQNNGEFDGVNLNSGNNAAQFIRHNGNVTKQYMYDQVEVLKQKSKDSTKRGLMMNIVLNALGIIISLAMVILLMFGIARTNKYQVQIMSVFLEMTEKDILNFSSKTENFIVLLHVDDSNEATDNNAENMDKKGSMFAKKKSYKATPFSKVPYFVFSLIFFVFSAYYIHSFTYNFDKANFLSKAGNYVEVMSLSRDTFSTEQARIELELEKNFGSTTEVHNPELMNSINKKLLKYQKDVFSWHYDTYGIFDEYHQIFSNIFMKDICNGEIKIPYACESGPIADDGTLLILTDVTAMNEELNLAEPLSLHYEFSLKVLKHSFFVIFTALIEQNQKLLEVLKKEMTQYLIGWLFGVFVTVIALLFYVHKFIIKDVKIVQSTLKFFPVHMAKESPGIRRFVAEAVGSNDFN